LSAFSILHPNDLTLNDLGCIFGYNGSSSSRVRCLGDVIIGLWQPACRSCGRPTDELFWNLSSASKGTFNL